MAGAVRSRGVSCGQLVLFAALLFGIVTMHTVGHPAEHGGRAASLSSAGPAADPSAGPAAVIAEDLSAIFVAHSSPATMEGFPSVTAESFSAVIVEGFSSAAVMTDASAAVAAHPSAADTATTAFPSSPGTAHTPGHGSGGDAPMSGMDPLSVCLAVLGAWGLALLATWLLLGLRADGRRLGAPVGAGLLRAARPNPPPSISVLAAVSVLRM
ncbi:hypothetical protein [Streptomyces californicus]|uniref:hypothetical protein n=1 Tax=Streptomyces californicus TaxID=67351 RepID=UPI0004C12696|nr:hypothetical protein [Streptomyces californicus]NEA09014.1 hypothetical protein [Streptomyces sp. SID10692]QRV57318.1 hypothetical protein I6J40_26410 [Streptomyces californicus]